MIIDKYQEEPPSNQEWTAGDDHPDIGSTEDWVVNVTPLTKHELHDFKGLLNSVAKGLKSPNVFTHRNMKHCQTLMRIHHTRWTDFEM